MNFLFGIFKRVLFWSYERGSWQYDVMCVLILAFVFAVPSWYFHSRPNTPRPISIASERLLESEPERRHEEILAIVAQEYGSDVKVSRVEPLFDEAGKVKVYLVWEEQ